MLPNGGRESVLIDLLCLEVGSSRTQQRVAESGQRMLRPRHLSEDELANMSRGARFQRAKF